jgi:hypothetical protein
MTNDYDSWEGKTGGLAACLTFLSTILLKLFLSERSEESIENHLKLI